MSKKEKLIHELKEFFWTFLYFLLWFGVLMLIKVLLSDEYQIQFYSLTTAVIGALIVAKVVLIAELLPVSKLTINSPAYLHIIFRTIIFSIGVFIVLALEEAFDGRHHYDGFINSLLNLFSHINIYHVYLNTICVAGALIGFELKSLVTKYLGGVGFGKILLKPFPETAKELK